MNQRRLSHILNLAVALIFILAAPHKILFPAEFALSVASYDVLPLGVVNLVAISLPWLEVLIAVLLIFRIWTASALLAANILFVIFLWAVSSAAAKGIDVNCGCFTSTPEAAVHMTWYIVRDIFFVVLGFSAAWFQHLVSRPK